MSESFGLLLFGRLITGIGLGFGEFLTSFGHSDDLLGMEFQGWL